MIGISISCVGWPLLDGRTNASSDIDYETVGQVPPRVV